MDKMKVGLVTVYLIITVSSPTEWSGIIDAYLPTWWGSISCPERREGGRVSKSVALGCANLGRAPTRAITTLVVRELRVTRVCACHIALPNSYPDAFIQAHLLVLRTRHSVDISSIARTRTATGWRAISITGCTTGVLTAISCRVLQTLTVTRFANPGIVLNKDTSILTTQNGDTIVWFLATRMIIC